MDSIPKELVQYILEFIPDKTISLSTISKEWRQLCCNINPNLKRMRRIKEILGNVEIIDTNLLIKAAETNRAEKAIKLRRMFSEYKSCNIRINTNSVEIRYGCSEIDNSYESSFYCNLFLRDCSYDITICIAFSSMPMSCVSCNNIAYNTSQEEMLKIIENLKKNVFREIQTKIRGPGIIYASMLKREIDALSTPIIHQINNKNWSVYGM
jgi:hypothetical protein